MICVPDKLCVLRCVDRLVVPENVIPISCAVDEFACAGGAAALLLDGVLEDPPPPLQAANNDAETSAEREAMRKFMSRRSAKALRIL